MRTAGGLCLYSLQDQRGCGQSHGEDEWPAPQRPQSVCGQIQVSEEQEECGARAKEFTSVYIKNFGKEVDDENLKQLNRV